MIKQIAIILGLGVAAFSLEAETWKNNVSKLVDNGEFAEAELALENLSEAEKNKCSYEIDSLKQIMRRIKKDFRITPALGKLKIEDVYGHSVTAQQIEDWKAKKYIEYKIIDGQEWWFRKCVGNFKLMNREDFFVANEDERKESYKVRERYYNEALKTKADKNGTRNWHTADLTMTIDVDADVVPSGETIRVWMPFPYENLRQKNIRLVKSSHPVTYSEGSIHHTVYMEAKAEKGKNTHFEINYAYEVGERHIGQAEMLKKVKPYDVTSELYKKYTSSEYPHQMITPQMKDLAYDIVGNETNPVLQASKVYDWIVTNYKWAGAREYSTIPNIPEYVLYINHGDCGQVSLLYITLMRCLGIPAKWESGWMLDPGEVNLHDWAETYFEGIGWVPTDVSFGRGTHREKLADYYKSGIDLYRLAANEGVCDQFSPKKDFIRSETVDSQTGEVEWRGGNLEYGNWHYDLIVNSLTPVK